MRMKILVTGGAGFIGSNFIRFLIRETDVEKVINIDKLTYAGDLLSLEEVEKDNRYTFKQVDVCDCEAIKNILNETKPQVVIHFAAESHVDRSIDNPGEFIQTNVMGTFFLLEAVRGYWEKMDELERGKFRFYQISTDEVYGSLGDKGYFSEDTPYAPNSPYSASKAAADHLVRAYYHTYQLPILISNCSNNFGPYQFPEKLIPLMILNAIHGKNLPVYGDGKNVRDWLYVEDHCRAIYTVLQNSEVGEVYNIGGNNEKTNLEIVENICLLLDEMYPRTDGQSYKQQIVFVPDRPGHDRRYAINANKIKAQLGWKPEESFESGIRKTIAWYLANSIWCKHIEDKGCIGKRLGIRENVTS